MLTERFQKLAVGFIISTFWFVGLAGAVPAVDECTANAIPSFDCSKAESVVEKSICELPEVTFSDCIMGKIYRDAKVSARRNSTSAKLLDEQRKWLHERDDFCAPYYPSKIQSCLIAQDEMRSWQLLEGYKLLPSDYGFSTSDSGHDFIEDTPPSSGPVVPSTAAIEAANDNDPSTNDLPADQTTAPAANSEQSPSPAVPTTPQVVPSSEQNDSSSSTTSNAGEENSASPSEAQQEASRSVLSKISAFIFLAGILVCALFFLPTIIAFNRKHPNRWVILLINAVFGVTVVGWFVSLIWSLGAVHISQRSADGRASNGGESGLNIFANDEKLVRVSIAQPLSRTSNIVEELQKLSNLWRSGAISEAEFNALKSNLLGGAEADTSGTSQQLERLDKLLHSGALSQQEYDVLREQVLSSSAKR